jgi:steroid delta-isomerase-like uncharacterized protein
MKTRTVITAAAVILSLSMACNRQQQSQQADTEMKAMEQSINETEKGIVEAWNTNDSTKFKEISVPNVSRITNGNKEIANQEEYISFMKLFHTAFPDFKVTVDSSINKDNKSFIYWTVTGTNTGIFGDNQPTGKQVLTHGFSIWTYNNDGKAVREDAYYDNLTLYQQLGYSLTPPAGN